MNYNSVIFVRRMFSLKDIEIAQQAEMLNINEIAAKVDLEPADIEQYGDFKAKIKLPINKKIKLKRN